ncbi:MAG TPA: hypothetical protein VMR45_00430 [Patescibacteria group bacterium]|nr:hypothetical protein [Patescibacteria group bacterium]
MPPEQVGWTPLSQEQADFFSSQIAAVSTLAFGPAAHDARILPLNAYTLSVRSDEGQIGHIIVWPDPYAKEGACMVVGDRSPQIAEIGSFFLRLCRVDDGCLIEGVAIPPGYTGAENLYGKQLVGRGNDEGDPPYMAHCGLDFVAAVQKRPLAPIAGLAIRHNSAPRIIGADNDTVDRLFLSLNTFRSNLTVRGATPERAQYASQTYDLASSYVRMLVNNIRGGHTEGIDGAVVDENRPVGGFFETTDGEVVIVRRNSKLLDTVMLVVAKRSDILGDTFFTDQYHISPSGVRTGLLQGPAESFSPQGLVRALNGHEQDEFEPVDSEGVNWLDTKIINLMAEETRRIASQAH